MVGVILGILLLLLLIGLVVLQGMIEWGNFDLDKFFGKKAKPEEIKSEQKTKGKTKTVKKAVTKKVKKGKKK